MTSSSPVDDALVTGPGTATLSVLVVDDHHGFRTFARRLLEAAGFKVIEATTGAEAVAVARGSRPDLVLLDVQLPDLDGFEVAELLAAQEPPPVVVLTSTREESDYGDRARTSPAAGFLPKDELSAAVLQAYLVEGQS
jgi:CheY-like chemotaxis protein